MKKCIFYCIGIIWVPFNVEKQNKTLDRLYLNLFFELAPGSLWNIESFSLCKNLLNHFLFSKCINGLGKSISLDSVLLGFKVLLVHCMLPILLKFNKKILLWERWCTWSNKDYKVKSSTKWKGNLLNGRKYLQITSCKELISKIYGNLLGTAVVKNSPANAWDTGNAGSIHGLGIDPGVGNGNPLQYSCLENFMDRGAW